jgi:hypothetical protein
VFPRREIRQAASQMVDGLLMELEDYNCWSIARRSGTLSQAHQRWNAYADAIP